MRPIIKLVQKTGVALVLSAALTAPASAKSASCLLVVNGQEAIRGTCQFSQHSGDGSFTITGLNGKYFAYVNMNGDGSAQGYWNETPYTGKAHGKLGRLFREDGCWVNNYASVCAW